MKSPLTSRLQEQSTIFAESKRYELIDFGIYAKTGWQDRQSFYGVRMGLNLINQRMGLILVWFNDDDYTACSKEFEARSLIEFKVVFEKLDTVVQQLETLGGSIES